MAVSCPASSPRGSAASRVGAGPGARGGRRAGDVARATRGSRGRHAGRHSAIACGRGGRAPVAGTGAGGVPPAARPFGLAAPGRRRGSRHAAWRCAGRLADVAARALAGAPAGGAGQARGAGHLVQGHGLGRVGPASLARDRAARRILPLHEVDTGTGIPPVPALQGASLKDMSHNALASFDQCTPCGEAIQSRAAAQSPSTTCIWTSGSSPGTS